MNIHWGDAPTWLAVVVATFGGWVALRQLRQQGKLMRDEIERNKARDALLDGQLRQMRDRERSHQRQQAEQVDLTWAVENPQLGRSLIIVRNASIRPIRDIIAVIHTGEGSSPSQPLNCDVMISEGFGRGFVMPPENGRRKARVAVLRPGQQAGYLMALTPEAIARSEARVHFYDDAGYLWQLTNDLSLSLVDPDSTRPGQETGADARRPTPN